MTAQSAERLRGRRGFGWLAWIALAAVWFATVPVRPLLDPDEGRYSEIPREMLASGDWITPRLDGLKYFEKPPLQYWMTAVAYTVFGMSEGSARLWTVGLGFLSLWMAYAWTQRLYGESAGLAALLALALSPYFEIVAHLNLLDAGFAFWMSGAMFAFCLAQGSPEGSPIERRWMLVTWLAAALAVLSKGIVVGVLAGASLLAYSLAERDWRPWKRLHLSWGLPAFLLVAAPWFIAVSLRNPSFPEFFFVHEHFARFLTTVHQRVEPWWYFLVLLLIAALPWIAFLPGAARTAWLESELESRFKPLKFMIIFCAVTLVFFSASGSKLAPYILPLMPPLAAIAGAYIAHRQATLRWATVASGVFMLAILTGLIIYTLRHGSPVAWPGSGWLLAGAVAALGGILLAGNWKSDPPMRPVWIAAASAIFGWQCFLSAFADLPPQRGAMRIALAVRPLIHPGTELYSLGQYRETISPYLHRTLSLVEFQGELAFGLNEEPEKGLSADAFLSRWQGATDAMAFLDPADLERWRQRGLEGRVVAGDESTVAVSRL